MTKDNIVEESEKFDLTFIIPSSLKGQVLPGNITDAVGNIIDNSSKKKSLDLVMFILLFC